MTVLADCAAVEVTIDGSLARISEVRGTYVAEFITGPYAGEEVHGLSPRKAWFALRELVSGLDSR